MKSERRTGWASEEFEDVELGDKRLNARLVRLCDRFSESPESPINQACEDWAETKAAYRFFKNENVVAGEIMEAHRLKTAKRVKQNKTVLAIQDTSYFIYTNHPKTEGLGRMSLKKGKNVEKIYSNGLAMHSCLAVTTDGLPLGFLDQQIFVRELRTEEERKLADVTPIEDKESYRWLQSLKNTKEITGDIQVVTVCDREADIYELFMLSDNIKSPVLVRANVDRAINRSSRYAEKDVVKLWAHMDNQPEAGTITVDIPARRETQHCKERESRVATLTIKFGSFLLSPPRNNIKYRSQKLPDIKMQAVYAFEANPPDGSEAVAWMLLTNLPVNDFAGACEIVRWYCLRWMIEMYFKVLKSGFSVEECRLGDAERLTRYLTIMRIVAWRLFMITFIARTDPNITCTKLLADYEWKVLFLKINKNKTLPKKTPAIGEVVVWIARLGGFLARKGDGYPGTITLWRGWKRLADLTEGWSLAIQADTCG
ncbi:MAG: IS4 family transposase [Victivallales bacterium]